MNQIKKSNQNTKIKIIKIKIYIYIYIFLVGLPNEVFKKNEPKPPF